MLDEDKLKKALRKIGQNLDDSGTTDPQHFNQQDFDMLYSLAYSLYEAGDYEKAKTVFQRLVLLCPHEKPFWMGLASSHQMLKAYDDALTTWAILSLLDDEDPIVHLHAGECYVSLEQFDEAQKALRAFHLRTDTITDPKLKTELENRSQALSETLNGRLSCQ